MVKKNDLKPDDYVFASVESLSNPPDGFLYHYKDRWWMVHPDRGLLFYKPKKSIYPQCNLNRVITEQVGRGPRVFFPELEVKLIPHVFLRYEHDGEMYLP